MSETPLKPIEIGLTAAIVGIEDNEPLILTASAEDDGKIARLPFGPFDAVAHRTFEMGLRAWVAEQTGLQLGYVEQLYTFGDKGRDAPLADLGEAVAEPKLLDPALFDVAEDYLVAGSGEDVGDAVTHSSGAENSDGANRIDGHGGVDDKRSRRCRRGKEK